MQTDDELLSEASRGEQSALDELFRRHGPAVRRKLNHRIGFRWKNVLSEDDVMQQTYMDALQFISRFEPRGVDSFVNWLSNIARRNLVDAVRELQAAKRGGNRVQEQGHPQNGDGSYVQLFEQLAGSFTSPSQAAMGHEAKLALADALQDIPETYRVAIEKYDLSGASAEDVARECGCSVGAMHMRRSRGLAMLRSLLRSRTTG